jgi:hypothetical protein
MTTYNHTHPGSSLPYSRPGAGSPVAYTGSWRDLLVVLVVALFVVAAFISVIAVTGSDVPTATVHHGGAHGRATVLHQMTLSGVMQAQASRTSAGRFGGPTTVEKLRLARHHGAFDVTGAGVATSA